MQRFSRWNGNFAVRYSRLLATEDRGRLRPVQRLVLDVPRVFDVPAFRAPANEILQGTRTRGFSGQDDHAGRLVTHGGNSRHSCQVDRSCPRESPLRAGAALARKEASKSVTESSGSSDSSVPDAILDASLEGGG